MLKKIHMQLHLISYTLKTILKIDCKIMILVTILALINGIFPTFLLVLTQNIVNEVQLMESTLQEIFKLIIMYTILTCVSLIVENIYSYFMNKLNIILTYHINYMVMEKCGSLPLCKLEETKTYDQLSRIENGISNKPFQALQALIGLFSNIITFFSALSVLFFWKKWLCAIIIVLSIIEIYYNIRIGNKEFSMRYKRSNKERKTWYYSYLLTHDIAFKEIKVLNLNEYFLKKYWRLSKIFMRQDNTINKFRVVCGLIMSIFQDFFDAFVMILSIVEAYNKILLIGTAITNINILSLIRSSTTSFSSQIYSLYNSNLYMALLEEFLNIKTDIAIRSGHALNSIGQIELCNISFGYSRENLALHNISFKINKGECVAIVGNNGSGKSTLLKIMSLLYLPDKGSILIDGIDLTQISINSYHQHISVLFQDYLKYEGSLLENIHIGDVSKDIDLNEIDKVLGLTNVNFLKDSHTYNYHKTLGNWFNNGTELSGGQWQKIALSRVYYKDADVVFLDEPSSSLDAESEAKIFNCFFEQCKSKIGVYITHRAKIAQKASKIIVLEHGNIVGIGSHRDLYQKCKTYRDLVDLEGKV
jgi:ATP-binding cassette, subfamily B, bacterial NisT/SpaT